MINAVLWDLDGTLVDSVDGHWRAWLEIMNAERAPLTFAQFKATFGKRNDEILLEWFGERMSAARREEISVAKETLFRQMVRQHGLALLPGASDWIARLRAAGWAQAIATSAPRLNMDAMVEATGIGPWFDTMVAAEDVVNGKPDPEVFLTAAARLGATPERAIVVEDADAGVEAGRRAGMRVIGVRPGDPLVRAHVVATSLTDLPADTFDRLLLG
jgi:beta-phosphoglucomutase